MSKKTLYIIAGVAGALVLGLLIFLLLRNIGTTTPQNVSLQFWGVYDDVGYFTNAISEYEKNNPGIRITYKVFDFANYEKQLIGAFAANNGPDIWMMHNTWLPKHGDKIQPLPQTIPGQSNPLFTYKNFKDQFVDVAAEDLTYNQQIYALPLYVDTLALYYNKDLFNSAGISKPPATWNDFNDDVEKLTTIDSRNNIQRAGAAIGTAQNINRSTDILTLLMLQSGVQMTDIDKTSATFSRSVASQNVGEIALQYYTDFANPAKQVYTWNDQMHYSVDAFTEGSAAMMLNYSHQTATLKAQAPRFNFSVAPVPQPAGESVSISYANYWAPTVSKQSKSAIEAWKFLVYLSSTNGATAYINASSRPAARRDLIQLQQQDPDYSVFATQALAARSWYQPDNSAVETIFAEMIDNVNYGRATIRDALRTAEDKVNVLMTRNAF